MQVSVSIWEANVSKNRINFHSQLPHSIIVKCKSRKNFPEDFLIFTFAANNKSNHILREVVEKWREGEGKIMIMLNNVHESELLQRN